MSALKKLEEVTANKAYLGFAKLVIGYHKFFCFRLVKSKFGKKGEKSLLVELDDQVLFLPQNFSQKMGEDDIRELNENIEKDKAMYIYFGGRGGRDEKTKKKFINNLFLYRCAHSEVFFLLSHCTDN